MTVAAAPTISTKSIGMWLSVKWSRPSGLGHGGADDGRDRGLLGRQERGQFRRAALPADFSKGELDYERSFGAPSGRDLPM